MARKYGGFHTEGLEGQAGVEQSDSLPKAFAQLQAGTIHGTLVSAKPRNVKAPRTIDSRCGIFVFMQKRSYNWLEDPNDFPDFFSGETNADHDCQEDGSSDNDSELENCFNVQETDFDTFDCGSKYLCTEEIIRREFAVKHSCLSAYKLEEHGLVRCEDDISEQSCSKHKNEVQDGKFDLIISTTPHTTLQQPSKCVTVHEHHQSASNTSQREDCLDSRPSIEAQPLTEPSSTEQTISEPGRDPSALYQEEFGSDDDFALPDVDSMMLKLDLLHNSSDSYLRDEAISFMEKPRSTIRLEECTSSSMQRAILSQGAFAILCGQKVKHYVRKTETILGRSMGDYVVDIDLGLEGRTSRISRLQAVLKLEVNGVFSLKNVGKSLMHVNQKEFATGQISTLTSGSSIEIGGMTFKFEINERRVRRYLNLRRKNEGKDEFEWTETDG